MADIDETFRRFHAGRYESTDTLPIEDLDETGTVRNQTKLAQDYKAAEQVRKSAVEMAVEADKAGDKKTRGTAAEMALNAMKVQKTIRERSKARREKQKELDKPVQF